MHPKPKPILRCRDGHYVSGNEHCAWLCGRHARRRGLKASENPFRWDNIRAAWEAGFRGQALDEITLPMP